MTPDKCPRCGSDRLPISGECEIDQCRRKPGLPDAPDHCPAVIDGEVCGAPVRARGVDAFGCPWTDWTCGNGDSWGSHNSNCLTFIWERRREAHAALIREAIQIITDEECPCCRTSNHRPSSEAKEWLEKTKEFVRP